VDAVEIVEYDQSWPGAFRDVASRLRMTLGDTASRIDHIGSSSVAGLASQDIDIQVSAEQDPDLDGGARELEKAGWTPRPDINSDHDVPGWHEDERARRKRLFHEPPRFRRVTSMYGLSVRQISATRFSSATTCDLTLTAPRRTRLSSGIELFCSRMTPTATRK
jgi:GrpB-like predicted nucleotidyltransferase (UPF0157 family)